MKLSVEMSATHLTRIITTLAEAGISQFSVVEAKNGPPLRREMGRIVFARRFTVSCEVPDEVISGLREEFEEHVPGVVVTVGG